MSSDLYTRLINRQTKLSVIGLGYVGLPVSVAFAKVVPVVGFDINREKVDLYLSGKDPTHEVGDAAIRNTSVEFTNNPKRLAEASFHIVAVPTPIRDDKIPDLGSLISASRLLGEQIRKGDIVVYESTVYPGVTEEICLPILEEMSGLEAGRDFFIGYSPERINPGDKERRLETIVKVVSGMDDRTLDTIARVYELVVDAGVHRASSIKVAEAAKVIENSQRDINIAFMNELSMIFDKIGIPTNEVLAAAETKWNFLPFTPGLVGGHCIGVDPYYLTYKADRVGYSSEVILAGRKINDDMGRYVATSLIKSMIRQGLPVLNSHILILGFTFKENCPDTRNTRVIDIVRELQEYGVKVSVSDPNASFAEVEEEYGFALSDPDSIADVDAIIIAVKHDQYRDLKPAELLKKYRRAGSEGPRPILFDLKNTFERESMTDSFDYWSL